MFSDPIFTGDPVMTKNDQLVRDGKAALLTLRALLPYMTPAQRERTRREVFALREALMIPIEPVGTGPQATGQAQEYPTYPEADKAPQKPGNRAAEASPCPTL
jgi:hypothetical protein